MSQTAIQNLIEIVRNETELHGNTKERIASLLTLLNTEKMDEQGVQNIITQITNISPLFFDQFGNILDSLTQGWTLQYSDEEYVVGTDTKIIRKVTGYVGGTGTLPTELSDNVGKYFAKAGGFTTSKAAATDFRGAAGKDGENKIEKYVPGNTYLSGQQVITDDGWFGVRDGMNALSTDIPSEDSLVWEVIFDGASKEVDAVLKYFLENPSFAIQDETNYSDLSNVRTFVLDNSLRNITNIYVFGNSHFKDNFIVGKRENNTTIKLLGYADSRLYEQNFEVDFSQYKEITINFFTGTTHEKNPIVKTTRQSLNPPIEDAVKKYTDDKVFTNDQVLKAFKNGYEILVTNIGFNRGFMPPSLIPYNSGYGYWSEIPYKKGYNKIHYQAKFATNYFTTAMAIMAVLKDGSKVAIKQGGASEVINGVFDIPATTERIYVNFGDPNFIADPFPKNVYLFKEGSSEDSILNFLTKIYKIETPQNKSFLRLHRPKSLFRMDLDGTLPTDETVTRKATNMVMTIYDDHNEKYFKSDVSVKIQGNITAGQAKGSYSVKFKNDIGGKLKVKMGDWLPFSGFHLKGYPIDWAYTRTVSGGKLLKQFFDDRPFPQSRQGTFYPSSPNPLSTLNYLNEAKFHVDGVPTKVFLNGTFLGISVMQQSRDAEIFHINEDDIDQIFITNNNGFVVMDMYDGFKDNMWEVRSPKMDGYEEGLPVPVASVQTKLDRFFNWYRDVYAGTQSFDTTKQDYINIDNWVDVFVHSQVIGNIDFGGNNLNFAILNGLTYQFVTDMDITAGANGMAYDVRAKNSYGYSQLLPQIKARYADLRNKKIISLNNLHNIYNEIPAMIGGEEYIKNYSEWTGLVTKPSVHSIPYIMKWFSDRLVWLDSQMGYTP